MMNVQIKDTEKMQQRLETYQALLSTMGYEDRREKPENTMEPPKSMGLGTGGGCLL